MLTRELVGSGLAITRATVKPSVTLKGQVENTIYVCDEYGREPDLTRVEDACRRAGLLPETDSQSARNGRAGVSGRRAFCFSFNEKSAEWAVGSAGSDASSRTEKMLGTS
jgi:hypothetical protein